MSLLETVTVQCPWCWEMIEIVVDTSAGDQSWIEDCSVCCHPITFNIRVDAGGDPVVEVLGEDD